MARKILFAISGPRLSGSTAFAAKTAAEAARKAGADVTVAELPKLKGSTVGCIACLGCQRSAQYRCVLGDEMGELVATLPQYDTVVIAGPVYFFNMSAQAKAFIDRTYSLLKYEGETLKTPLAKIQFAFIATSGDDEETSGVKNLYALMRDYCAYSGAPEPKFLHFGPCAGPTAFKADEAAEHKAAEFGRTLAK